MILMNFQQHVRCVELYFIQLYLTRKNLATFVPWVLCMGCSIEASLGIVKNPSLSVNGIFDDVRYDVISTWCWSVWL